MVEGIALIIPVHKEEQLNAEAFSKMKNLRFLKIGKAFSDVPPPEDLIRCNVQLPHGLNYLSNELHVINWHAYPLNYIPTSFQPNKLVELRMVCSGIRQLWKGILVSFSLLQMCIFFVFIKA